MQKVQVNVYLKGGKMLSGLMEQVEGMPPFIALFRTGFMVTLIPIDSVLYVDAIGTATGS